jgi:hypothetical protein
VFKTDSIAFNINKGDKDEAMKLIKKVYETEDHEKVHDDLSKSTFKHESTVSLR